jgi:ADP-heptose:LPS heptosyltransferase
MHMGAAMGLPVLALFGPTAPWRTGTYGKGHKVLTAGTECSPCFRKRCPDRRCMKELTVEMVFEAARGFLGHE